MSDGDDFKIKGKNMEEKERDTDDNSSATLLEVDDDGTLDEEEEQHPYQDATLYQEKAKLLLEMTRAVEETCSRRRRPINEDVTWLELESLLQELEVSSSGCEQSQTILQSNMMEDWNVDILDLVQMDDYMTTTSKQHQRAAMTPKKEPPQNVHEMTLRILKSLRKMLQKAESKQHELTVKFYDRKIQWAEEECKYRELQAEIMSMEGGGGRLLVQNRQLQLELQETTGDMNRLRDRNRLLKEELRDAGVVDLLSTPVPFSWQEEKDPTITSQSESPRLSVTQKALAAILDSWNKASPSFDYSDDDDADCFVTSLMDEML